MSLTQVRYQQFDIAKGITIAFVVYLHCLRGLVYGGIVPGTSWMVPTDYVVYTFVMPVFFLVSGFFFNSSLRKSRREFWIGRLKSIVYPYFLWSILQGSVQLIMGGTGATNSSFTLQDLSSILWKPIVPFWFLYALFTCNMLALLLRRIRSEFVVVATLLAYATFLHAAPGVVGDAAYAFQFFSLGVLVAQREWIHRIPSNPRGLAIITIGFIATALAFRSLSVPERLPLPASILGVVAILSLSGVLADSRPQPARLLARFLQVIGQCSMSIFVMHILVLGFVRTVYLHVLGIREPLALMPVAIGLAILIPAAVQVAASRWRIHSLLGWTPVLLDLGKPSPDANAHQGTNIAARR